MKTITLYEHGRATLNGWESWWTAEKTRGDWTEETDEKTFKVPEPWTHVYINGVNGNILRQSAEFATDSGEKGYLDTNKNGKPVIVNERTGKHTELKEVKIFIFDTSTIYSDIKNWEQSPEQLAAWTEETMENELYNIFGDESTIHDNGEEITLEELAKLYTETAHTLANELK